MRILGRLLFVLLLVVAACGDDETPVDTGSGGTGDGGGDDDLDSIEGEYLATEVTEDGARRELVPDTQIRLTLQDGTLGVNAGCNSIGGEYALVDGVLEAGAMSMTEMGCDEPRMAQDQWIAEFLSSSPTLTAVEEGFTLATDTTSITFVDASVVEPDVELVGTTWVVDTFIDGAGPDGAASSVPWDTPPTIVFEDNGFVTGTDGCNSFGYGGEQGQEPSEGLAYEVDGGTIRFSGSAVTTDMACPGVDTTLFWRVVEGDVTWEIDASRLTLTHPDGFGISATAEP